VTELEYELVADDFVAFNLHYFGSTDAGRGLRKSQRLMLSVVTPLLIFGAIGLIFKDFVGGAVLAVITGVIMWFLAPAILAREIKRSLARMNRDAGLGVTGLHRLVADDVGLREISAEREVAATWSGTDRIDETPGHAYIFIGPVQAFVIPKRIGEAAVAGFLDVVREHVRQVGESAQQRHQPDRQKVD